MTKKDYKTEKLQIKFKTEVFQLPMDDGERIETGDGLAVII